MSQQTWRRSHRVSVNVNYVCCGVQAVAVNDGGKVDRVCICCGIVVYDGGANKPKS